MGNNQQRFHFSTITPSLWTPHSSKTSVPFFGGYGNRRYYNDFITYDIAQNHWDTLHFSGDSISPRFFAATVMTPDNKYAYIYGGKGNETGDQNVGIQYYYDCYQLDLENKRIKKLWEHEAPKSNEFQQET